jgi:hypothetical protein
VAVFAVSGLPGGDPSQAPVLLEGPTNRVVSLGVEANLRVLASGRPPLRYQWRRNGTALPGANTPVLGIANASLADAGNYSVEVSNAFGTVTSADVRLTVQAAAPPRIVGFATPGPGAFTLFLDSPSPRIFYIESSPDLVHWRVPEHYWPDLPWNELTGYWQPSTAISFRDPQADSPSTRFYRLVFP